MCDSQGFGRSKRTWSGSSKTSQTTIGTGRSSRSLSCSSDGWLSTKGDDDKLERSTEEISLVRLPCEAGIGAAVRERSAVELSWLLAEGADPNELNCRGETPLFQAASHGDATLTFLLLEAGANPEHYSPSGLTALDLARCQDVATLIVAMTPRLASSVNQEDRESAIRSLPRDLRTRCRNSVNLCVLSGTQIDTARAPKSTLKLDDGFAESCSISSPLGVAEMSRNSAFTAHSSLGLCPWAHLDEGLHSMGISMGDYIPSDMDELLEDLMFRDITPEDYERLLQLDESVARPTESATSVEEGLRPVDAACRSGETCTVCLVAIELEDDAVALQCDHIFHRACISRWLTERSRLCPLCGETALSS